jgi:hypothetical protein
MALRTGEEYVSDGPLIFIPKGKKVDSFQSALIEGVQVVSARRNA